MAAGLVMAVTAAGAFGEAGWEAPADRVAADSKQFSEFNYIEERVPEYELPDPLQRRDGSRVESVEDWPARRAEILELFQAHVYGRSPGAPASLTFDVVETNPQAMDGAATLKRVSIRSENNGARHEFELVLFTPNSVAGPAPLFLLMNNRSPRNTDPTREQISPFWPAEELIARGYGVAALQVRQLAPDHKDRWREGVVSLFERDAQRPDGWGALAAWGWGASRAMDYLETDPAVDVQRVALVGHSRGGKASLWAAAVDERFAMAISNSSGCGGAALSRRRYGETLASINRGFPHWFCANFHAYNGREDELPIDQHQLIALIAPRPVYVASANEDLWADPRGEFLSVAHASPAYGLWSEPVIAAEDMPPLDRPLIVGNRGYHVRSGGHNLTVYDWQRFMDFADEVWRQG